ncbi:MAG: virulence factor family protein [Bacteroidota bacterium]|nr:virulence factor family protein [Bacteroidota bacterium]
MLKVFSLLLCYSVGLTVHTAAQDLPITSWDQSTRDKPLVLYLSGDGGINRFSTDLCENIHDNGFEVYALNSRSYFYSRKTPDETAEALGSFLNEKLNGRPNQQVVLIGYSFGADVLPFILNRLQAPLHDKVLVTFLVASSGSTDFEIHWADILGGNSRRSMDVVSEINKVGAERLVIISASDDRNLDINRITLSKYTREVLPGGHHFDGNTDEISKVILSHIYR